METLSSDIWGSCENETHTLLLHLLENDLILQVTLVKRSVTRMSESVYCKSSLRESVIQRHIKQNATQSALYILSLPVISSILSHVVSK